MFYIDTRESDLIRLMNGLEGMSVKQLQVADIWIGVAQTEVGATASQSENGVPEYGKGGVAQPEVGATASPSVNGVIIERKSIRDLEASILDGRYREQRGRILAYCQENNTQPMYILEGSLSSGTGRLQKKAIMKFINRLIFHYQIPVMQTASVQETAELVQTLVEQWKDDPKNLQRTTELVKVTDGIHIQKKVNASDHRQFAISCLAQCPGISVKMAEAIVEEFGTLPDVINADAKQIEVVKVGNRKVGPVVSKRLSDILGGLDT